MQNISTRSIVAAAGAGLALACTLAFAPAAVPAAFAETAAQPAAQQEAAAFPLTVTDLSGFEVTVEQEPQSIGALLGNSYEHVFFLGAADRVSARMALGTNAWIKVIDPAFETYQTEDLAAPSCREPNIEELAALGVDTVFYWAGLADQKANMQDAGITVIESNPSGVEFTTVEEWRQLLKDEMNLYAAVLGPEAQRRADAWADYVDETIDLVLERTADLDEGERPTVYCIRNQEDGLQCFAKSSYFSMMVEAAGGTLVTKDVDTNLSGFTTVTMEDVATWNPQYVFLGWLDDPALLTENEQWASIAAIEDGNVYTLPCSLNSTDWAYYAESPLELLYVAKTLHPELFEDIDLVECTQEFYRTFYGAELSAEQVQAMFDRQDPDGSGNDSF